MSMLKKYVIIVAGGSGNRMGTETPKQFLELAGMPVLMHTITAFRKAYQDIDIVVVLPESQVKFWKNLCIKYNFIIPFEVCGGGDTRYQSVKNGLALLDGDGLVGIHDGVRPLVTGETIKRCYHDAAIYGNAIPVVDVVETVRYTDIDINKVIDRSKLRLVQTPQVFRLQSIKEAFKQGYMDIFTDDASVFENFGGVVHLTEGNKENIKLTHPSDMIIGESLLLSLQHERYSQKEV
jgi:2-C-methyl-D-erythritol 4-phosphate cytidylyltransferase